MVSKTNKILNKIRKDNRSFEPKSPIATGMYLPNHSGDHQAGRMLRTPENETDLVNKEYVDSIATRQAIELFLTTNASDIGTYDDLDIDVSPDAETTITQTITAGATTLINAFASKLDEEEVNAIEILESGIYDLHIHAEANFPNGMTIYFEFYHRTAGGTETLLGTSHDSDILGLTETEIGLHASITEDKIFISGDRIVVKVYGRNTGGANKDITIHMEGDTVSRTEFPGFISPTFVPDHASAHEIGGSDLVDHDALTNYVANEHIDWTNSPSDFKISKTTPVATLDGTGATLILAASGGVDMRLGIGAAAATFGTTSNHPLRIRVNATNLFHFLASGRMGIGVSSPTSLLDLKSAIANSTGGIRLTENSGTDIIAFLYEVSAAKSALLLRDSSTAKVLLRADDGNCYVMGSNFGLNVSTPAARFEIQTETDEGKEAMIIDQNDADKPFIDYQGATAASATATISTFGSIGTRQGFLQIEVNGTRRWIPFYDDPSA